MNRVFRTSIFLAAPLRSGSCVALACLTLALAAHAESAPPLAPSAMPDVAAPGTAADVAATAAVTPEVAAATAEAAPAGAAGNGITQPPATLGATDAFNAFRSHFDGGRYAAAVPYAQRVLEVAERDATAPDAEEVQVALMNLAMAQYLAADHTAAEATYLRAIELIEGSGRPLHSRLARAYAGLASSYHDADRHELAVTSFEQAVALTRRHEGVLTEQQVPLLEKYVDSLTTLGRYEEALRGQRYILRVAARKHGENSVELAPTLEKIGRWYARVGAYEQARRLLKRSIDLVETVEGPMSPRLLGPLATLAACNRKQLLDPTQHASPDQDTDRAPLFADPGVVAASYSPAMLVNEAEKSLARAVTIAEGRPDPSPSQVADARTQLGDWYQGRGQPERALPNYQAAWTAAARAPQAQVHGRTLHEALFGQPVLLQVVRPDGWNRYSGRPPEQVEIRNVQLEFTVTARGRVETVKVIDDTGDPRRADKTAYTVEQTARYRPRMAHGEPVATERVTFSQPWIVLLPEAPDGSDGATRDPPAARTATPPQATESASADKRPKSPAPAGTSG
ncbi:MAG TPA: tetratricopeptide repeat protein [Steroidobacteraceae bacterium]|nr:tetratricopeptide repeat protein [Steroidobacteraceae bacterium]